MKNLKFCFLILLLGSFSSCLTNDLEDLPTYSEADILNVKFEYRWSVKEGTSEKLRVESFITDFQVDENTQVINCIVTVPQVGDEFTESIRSKVSLDAIIGYTSISPAATIIPLDDAPKLGVPGDWTQPNTYLVEAADGSTKEWVIEVVEFNK